KASDAKREPLATEQIGERKFLVRGSGKVWIAVTCVDFARQIFEEDAFTIDIGASPEPIPPDPPAPPEPEPDPVPDVPADRFDNLGQRVAQWAVGLPARKAISGIYQTHAGLLL